MGYRRWKCHLISIAYLLLPALVQAGPPRPPLHHELQVRLDPAANTLQASDRITFPAPRSRFDFLLHAGLKPELKGPGATLAPGERVAGPVPLRRWRVRFEPPSKRLDLTYRGRINQPFATLSQGYAGGRRTTAGTISSKGVFLAGSSYWYPRPTGEDAMLTFSLATGLPDGWLAVSQGRRGADGRSWEETAPQDEIYLVAGPFHRYARRGPVAEAAVYLRDPDPALARRYLAATDRYLSLYDRLIGPYPYAKFALVENFWESGYGMPSFTLLGPRVIRLPFILHSSYPHEILHNWWGNGVYVDYATGNWSEGMTSYFADHLIREQQGKGAEYRRDTLQRYADFVARDEDFPLRAFRGNRGEVSQAVGYGKMLMFLHMLRRQLGDRAFLAGIRRFYRDNRFRVAGFDDLRKALEQAAGTGLGAMFRQWTGRAGAPALALEELRVERDGTGYRVRGRLRQTQAGAPFRLQVPLFLQLAGEPVAQSHPVEMEGREASLDIRIDRRPLRLAVDPRFDLFRRLAPGETPPSLGRLFGARGVTILLPRRAPAPLRRAYRQLAERWSRGKGEVKIRWDDAPGALPRKGAVWLFGRENRYAGMLARALPEGTLDSNADRLSLAGSSYPSRDFSLALAGDLDGRPAALLALASPAAMPGLARKLPHYGKQSYLLFEGEEPVNRLKGRWAVAESALTRNLAGGETIPPLVLPEERPLSELAGERVSGGGTERQKP